MRIAICDDIEEHRKITFLAVKEVFGENEYLFFNDGTKLLKEYEKEKIDLIFLDVVMNNGSDKENEEGIRVKNRLLEKGEETHIIFISNYSAYMNKAFGKNVIGYIEKPVDPQKIKDALRYSGWRLEKEKKINTHDSEIYERNIIYNKATYGYTVIKCTDGKEITEKKSLKKWEKELNKDMFCRANGTYIVAFHYIRSFSGTIVLEDGCEIHIAKGRIKLIKAGYERFIRYYVPLL